MLINKLELRTQEELDEAELALFLIRTDEQPPAGRCDYSHYMDLHHHLFQDVYDWAGKIRSIRIGKGNNWFCFPEYINREMKRVFTMLHENGGFAGLDPVGFADRAANLLAELNAIHPFREGNGRTQLAFLSLLADNAGLPFNDDLLDRDRVIAAMINSFDGNETPLCQLIFEIVSSQ